MSNIAYIRVSTIDQNEARQKEALQNYNIDKWYSQFTLKKEDRARSREVKEEREKRRKDLRLAQNFSMGLRSGE